MTNKLFRILFNSSILIPWLLLNCSITVINKKVCASLILFILTVLIIGVQHVILSWQYKHVRSLWITIDSCDGTQDKWFIPFLISSFTPLVEIGLDYNISNIFIIKWIGLIVLIAFIMLRTNHNFENLVLRFRGYKIYFVTADGVKYTLFSKKNIRKVKQQIYVKRIFEFVLMEEDN